jgi:hypothetical protein
MSAALDLSIVCDGRDWGPKSEQSSFGTDTALATIHKNCDLLFKQIVYIVIHIRKQSYAYTLESWK